MNLKVLGLFCLIALLPSLANAACDPKDDGSCCAKDSDCVAYVYPALCSVIPLNKAGAEELTQAKVSPLSSCDAKRIKELKKEASEKTLRCIDEACEF